MNNYSSFMRGLAAFCLVVLCLGTAVSQTGGSGPTVGTGQPEWAPAWGAAMYTHTWARLPEPRLHGKTTLRFILRTQYGGEQARICLSNVHGSAPIRFEDVWIGIRQHGPGIVPESHQPVLFKGNRSPLIHPGAHVVSDPVHLDIRAFEELAVSFYIEEPTVITDYHRKALVTSYLQTGNMAADEVGPTEPARLLGQPYPFATEINYVAWVDLLEVKTTDSAGVIVAFGDSITDGSCAPDNTYASWPDLLAERIYAAARGEPYKSVINMGIAGNTLEAPQMAGRPGVSRFDNDVLKLSNVTDVVIWLGTTAMQFVIIPQHHAAAEGQVRYPRLRVACQEYAGGDIWRGILFPPGYFGQVMQTPGQQVARNRNFLDVIIGMSRQGAADLPPALVQALVPRVHEFGHAAETPVDVGDHWEAASPDVPEQDGPIALFLRTRNHRGQFITGVHLPLNQVYFVPGYQGINVIPEIG